MAKPNRLYSRTELLAQSIFTTRQWGLALSVGYVGAIKAPTIIQHSSRTSFVSAQQVEEYKQRETRWRNNYYNGLRTSKYLGMPKTEKPTWENSWLKNMLRKGRYLDIVAPLPYRFISVADAHYHIADLSTMRKYLALLTNGELSKDHPTYVPELEAWSPPYMMPVDDEFSARYTEGTKRLLQHRNSMSAAEVARLRLYRDGSWEMRKNAPRQLP